MKPASHKIHRHKLWHYIAGAFLCFIGSSMALHAAVVQNIVPWCPHPVVDMFAYMIHGIGSIPIVATFETFFE